VAGSISPGTVLWVRLHGRGKGKKRSAIALTVPDLDGNLAIVVCSAQVGEDPENEIVLPWSRDPRTVTHFRKPVVAVMNWIVQINEKEIIEQKGCVPNTKLEEILNKIKS
jgi:hypothetical protein